MSTLTSKFVLAAGCLSLAACAVSMRAPQRAELRVMGETIAVVPPVGLCIDPRSVDVGRAGGTVLVTDCILTNPDAATESIRLSGVMTVAITTTPAIDDLDVLEEFLRGPGKLGLSNSGDAETVSVLDSRRDGGSLFIKVRDTGPRLLPGAATDYWRVFFAAGPRLTTATVFGFEGAILPDGEAIRLLGELAARTSAANVSS